MKNVIAAAYRSRRRRRDQMPMDRTVPVDEEQHQVLRDKGA
jgi:hypothetical protein